MTQALFGKNIERTFAVDDGNSYIALPTQTPTIYVFDYAPTYAQAAAGTNAVATISTWTASTDNKLFTYTIPAIVDPDANSSILEREYWECVKYVHEAAGSVQPKLRMFTIRRADALESIPGTNSLDIRAIWPGVDNYITESQLQDYLPIAESHMRIAIGFDKWPRLSKLSDAKICLAYKAIELMAAGQVAKGAKDKFVWMVDYFRAEFSTMIAKLDFPIDLDGDGKPDTIEETSQGYVILAR